MKERPLKKDDLVFIKEGDGKVNFDGYYAIPLVRHQQAVEYLKSKIRDLPNRDDWLQEGLPVAKGVSDGGGVGRFEVIDLIDEAFEDVWLKKMKIECYSLKILWKKLEQYGFDRDDIKITKYWYKGGKLASVELDITDLKR